MNWKRSVLFGLTLPACVLENSDVARETGDETDVAISGAQILADVAVTEGHHVQFIETLPGVVTFSEVGPGDPANAVLRRFEPGNLVDVYESLGQHGATRDEAVVERLAKAQLRVDALRAELTAVEARGGRPSPIAGGDVAFAAGEAEAGVGSQRQALLDNQQGPHPVVTDQEFRTLYCNAAELGLPSTQQHCAIRSMSTNVGWFGDVAWTRSIVVNVAASAFATHNLRQFVCVDSLPIIGCIRRDWRTRFTQSIAPENYGIFVDNFKWTKFSASSNGPFNLGAVWFF